jgi:hypothetical protein
MLKRSEVLVVFKDLIPIRAKIRSKYPVMVQPIQQQIIQLLLRKGCRMADQVNLHELS